MINWDKINKKISVKKVILPFFVVILILLIFTYFAIFHKYILKDKFVQEMELIAKKNETPTFSVEKIYLCSSANAIDKTQEQKLDKLDIYQYTDIAVYINNYKDEKLTNKNTVKELYIDNIDLKLDYNIGQTSLVYTNLLKIGSREELANMLKRAKKSNGGEHNFAEANANESEFNSGINNINESELNTTVANTNINEINSIEINNNTNVYENAEIEREESSSTNESIGENETINFNADRIDFNIVTTNEQNNDADYEKPTFYADCSNPISLKYINKINREYSVGKDNSAVLDGTILAKAGIKPEDINARIKFKINLVNNNGEYYSSWINFKIPLKDIDKGVSIKSKTTVGSEYNFFNS